MWPWNKTKSRAVDPLPGKYANPARPGELLIGKPCYTWLQHGKANGPYEYSSSDPYMEATAHAVGSTFWLRQQIEKLEKRLTRLEAHDRPSQPL